MNLKAKRKHELDTQKEKRKEEVIKAAVEVFKEEGINNTKMTDIAHKAQFGVATIYRYFKTKNDLVIAAGTWLWNNEIRSVYTMLHETSFKEQRSVDRIKTMLGISVNIFLYHPHIMGFLEQFDNYIIKEKLPIEKLEGYEKSVVDMKRLMFDAIEQGKEEGLIKEDVEMNAFYTTITHALMSLSQKLILRGEILDSDKEIQGEEQLRLLVDMAMFYILK